MATIQVRDIPEACYEVLRRRARQHGQSIQAYMRDQLVALASRPTREEALATIHAVLDHAPERQATVASILEDLAVDRR